jgi:hypothetical protein
MPQFDEKHIKLCGCFVVWDGITRPDKNPDGSPKYSLKVVVPVGQDLQLYSDLANRALQESKWKGTLPAGARMPVGQAQAHEFNGMYNGWAVLNCNSQRLPDVYDEAGQPLDPMQYGQLLYGGQQVDVLVHCYEYDKAGNKGIATGLDGFAIIVSANAQRQQFGNAGIDTSGAFGGGGRQPTQGYQQSPQQQNAAPQVQYDPNTGQPIQQQQNAAPQVQYDPNTGQPIQPQAQAQPQVRYDPNTGQPIQQQQNAAPQVQYDPNTGQPVQQGGQQPQQAHDFLPQG